MKPEDWPPEAVEALREALLEGLRRKRPGHVIIVAPRDVDPPLEGDAA